MHAVRYCLKIKLIIALFFSVAVGSYAQNNHPITEPYIHLLFAAQLPLFITWPREVLDKKIEVDKISNGTSSFSQTFPQTSPRIIHFCVGKFDFLSDFIDEVSHLKTIGYMIRFDIVNIEHPPDDCHIVFINKKGEDKWPFILLALKNKDIMTVSDMNNFAEKGGMIAVSIKNNRLIYRCNLKVMQKVGFVVSSRMLELADKIY